MDIVGITVICLLVSWTGLCIERCASGNEMWMVGFIVTLLGIMFSFVLPFKDVTLIHKPMKVEKTTFNLVCQDANFGVVMTENVSLYNSETNKIIIWKKESFNILGGSVKDSTGIGSIDDADVITAMKTMKTMVTNEVEKAVEVKNMH